MDQTVNLTSSTSVVRIHLFPPGKNEQKTLKKADFARFFIILKIKINLLSPIFPKKQKSCFRNKCAASGAFIFIPAFGDFSRVDRRTAKSSRPRFRGFRSAGAGRGRGGFAPGADGAAPPPVLRSRRQCLCQAGWSRPARISVYPLARACPRLATIPSRRQAASAFPALRAPAASEPFPKARRGYFINISLYIIVDTVVFLTPLFGTFEPLTVPKYLPFPGKRNSPRTISMQGLFFIGFIHDEKCGRATLLFPVQCPAGSFSSHHDDLLGGRQQSHIFPSFMRNPAS